MESSSLWASGRYFEFPFNLKYKDAVPAALPWNSQPSQSNPSLSKRPRLLRPRFIPTEPSTLRSLHLPRCLSSTLVEFANWSLRETVCVVKPPRFSRAARDCHPLKLSTLAENAFSGKRARDTTCRGILKRNISERRWRDAHIRISLNIRRSARRCVLRKKRVFRPPVRSNFWSVRDRVCYRQKNIKSKATNKKYH